MPTFKIPAMLRACGSIALLLLLSANVMAESKPAPAATKTVLPFEKLQALGCEEDRPGESCCERWIGVIRDAATTQANTARELPITPSRLDKWRAEGLSYCAMRDQVLKRVKLADRILNEK